MSPRPDEEQPLLSSNRDYVNLAVHGFQAESLRNTFSTVWRIRMVLRWFLTSKYGHYFVIILVALDVAGIFADFLIKLHMCEHSGKNLRLWQDIDEALDVISLVFSCLFMFELLCSIFAFGPRYFKSKFHIFDGLSILASFLVDVFTHGPVEEAGSLIIVLRLFRVFKIIEESSTVAEDSLDKWRERVSELEKENASLRQRDTNQQHTREDD